MNKKKIMIPIAVFGVLVFLLAGVAVAVGLLGGNGKKQVTEALEATFTESRDAVAGVWEMDAYAEMFEKEQMSVNADFTIADEMGMNIRLDVDGQTSGIYMDLSYLGNSMMEAILYIDEAEIRLGFPSLVDYFLYVDRTTLEEDLFRLVDEGAMQEENARLLLELNQSYDSAGSSEMEQDIQALQDIIQDIYNEAEMEKADGKVLFVDGEEKNCKGYQMNVTAEQLSEICLAYQEMFPDLEEIPEPEEDVSIFFYLYDKVLAQIYVEMDEDNYLEWNMEGGSFPLENTELIFVTDGEESILSRKGSLEEDSYSAEYAFDMDDEELTFAVSYEKSSGDFAMEIHDYYSELFLTGNIDRTIPGSELTVTMDSEESLYGELTISGTCTGVEKPEGEEVRIMELSDTERYALIEEIMYRMIYGMY